MREEFTKLLEAYVNDIEAVNLAELEDAKRRGLKPYEARTHEMSLPHFLTWLKSTE